MVNALGLRAEKAEAPAATPIARQTGTQDT
jgi:hypothetical protein